MSYAKVENYMGVPTFTVDGKPIPPMSMTITTRSVDKLILDVEYYKKLGESGIKLFYVFCDTKWFIDSAFESLKTELETILSVIPDAYFILRMTAHPPVKWLEENPDAILTFNDGSFVPASFRNETNIVDYPGMYSFHSKKWQEAAGDAICEMLDECKKMPYSDRIIGVLIAAGSTSEWNYPTPIDFKEQGKYGDCSDAFKEYFSNYLSEKYNKKITDVVIPNCDDRYYAWEFDRDFAKVKPKNPRSPDPEKFIRPETIGAFLDVDNHQNTADFYRAWQLGKADALISIAKRIKQHDEGKITGAFFGGWGASNRISGTTAAILRILESPYVDFLSNPGVYENRQPGGFTGQRSMLDSFKLHNKLYIVEDDIRTHKENRFWRDMGELFEPIDSVNCLKREFGKEICEDTHAWWFDQHYGGGRYKFDEAFDLFKKQQKIADFAYSMPRRKNSEIAFIYDEESVHVTTNQTMTELVELFRNYEVARIGAPVDFYYHNDLLNPDMPDYKLYVFCNDLVLNDKEREAIKAKLKKNHATAIFVYAPGIINPDDENKMFDVKHITELTGIKCEMLDDKITPAFKACTDELALEKNKVYGLLDRFEMGNVWAEKKHIRRSYLYPAFFPCDENVKVLARFCENGKPAIVQKEVDGYTSILYGAKLMKAEVVREFAKKCGCHIYTDKEDVLYANENFITVHSSHNGKTEIALPEKCDVVELYEDKIYGENTDNITFDMYYGETKMFYLKKSE